MGGPRRGLVHGADAAHMRVITRRVHATLDGSSTPSGSRRPDGFLMKVKVRQLDEAASFRAASPRVRSADATGAAP